MNINMRVSVFVLLVCFSGSKWKSVRLKQSHFIVTPRCRQAGGQAEARLKCYLLAFIQLECERVTAAVNVQRAAAFRKKIEYKKRVTTVCQRRWQG